jgi:NAD(P)-dependent dehydrogenase (short-subunit alcohol dehydrogenase family)
MGVLDGKIAIVTGASHGIGRAIAVAFGHEGAKVVIAARNVNNLNEVAKIINADGSTAEVVPTDVMKEDQIENLFSQTMKLFGRLDILVNNAGVFDGGPFEQLSTETWDKVIATNLRAPFLCSRAAFRIMKKQGGGRIINIGSISAQRVRQNNAPYSSAKFGLVGLTHTIALEGRPFGITCGALHVGNTQREPASGDNSTWDKEPKMSAEETATAVVYMACQPPHINVLEIIQLPREQLYLGRG